MGFVSILDDVAFDCLGALAILLELHCFGSGGLGTGLEGIAS